MAVEKNFGEFRFVDKQETLAVCDISPFKNQEFLKFLAENNFHVFSTTITDTNQTGEQLKKYGIPQTKIQNQFTLFFHFETNNSDKVFEVIEKMHAEIKKGKKVLVQCIASSVLSPVIVGTYLVIKRKYSIKEAIKAVRLPSESPAIILKDIETSVEKYYKTKKTIRKEKRNKFFRKIFRNIRFWRK